MAFDLFSSQTNVSARTEIHLEMVEVVGDIMEHDQRRFLLIEGSDFQTVFV